MAESKLVFEFGNTFLPPFVSMNLNGMNVMVYRLGIDKVNVRNFWKILINILNRDIRNSERLDKKIIRQYQTVDFNTIKTYPPEYHQQITSSIF